MNNKIYHLIDQEKDCCLIACLQMILQRHNLSYETNQLVLRENNFEIDENGMVGFSKGIDNLNDQFFIPNKYPLREKNFTSASMIDRYGLYLKEDFENNDYNDDILIFGNFKLISKGKDALNDNLKPDILHCLLVECVKDNNVYLVNPEVKEFGGTKVIKTTLDNIEFSMSYYYGKNPSVGYSIIKEC